MKKIILFSHNPQRDANFDAMLAQQLGKNNTIWVRRFLGGDYQSITTIKPDVIILPEIRCEYTVDLAKQCKQYGIQVVVRACEVGITRESLKEISTEYRNAIFGNWDVNDCIDLFIGWGPEMCRLFVEYGRIDASKVFPAGSCGFDQYKYPIDIPQKPEKPILLFATGFPYADRNREYALPEAKSGDKLHSDMVALCQQGRSSWLKMIPEIIKHFGDGFEYWLRVHGGEKEIVYQTVLKDLPIKYTSRNQAIVDIALCSLLIHCGSTLAYEAHLLNKPAFNFCNINKDVVLSNISPKIGSMNDMIKAIEKAKLTKSNTLPSMIEYAEQNYYGIPDGQSHIRAAEVINSLPENKTSVPDTWQINKEAKYMTDGVLLNVERWVCNACGNQFFINTQREMVKCPFCGIACVKIQGATNAQK